MESAKKKNDDNGDDAGVERGRVGLLYDERMCKHHTPDGEDHPENPERIRAIWRKLQSAGITQRCVVLNGKAAEDEHIASVHAHNYIKMIRNLSTKEVDPRRNKIASKFNSIYLNGGSSEAAYLAAGSVIEVSEKVAKGELSSAVAIVRPPGHHAESNEAMGFCIFNNVAVAASYILDEKLELGIHKILIVDWDVHHGNGTQKMFWKDSRVLFFSVHRFDFGTFYPTGDDGSYTMVGEGQGAGYNINVPWEHGQCGDADYLAVWDHILIPVAKEFNPDMIIISGGFDAAVGDPLGGCRITPYGYSVMMKKLLEFAEGKIVLALEGGYNLDSIANSVLACVKVLLEDKPLSGALEAYPFESTWRVIRAVRKELCTYWPILSNELPKEALAINKKVFSFELISSSDSDAENDEAFKAPSESKNDSIGNLVEKFQNVIRPLSLIPFEESAQVKAIGSSVSWRAVFAKTDIWYACFGSNMWMPRFLCYIQGGQVEGMQKPFPGSIDKRLPKDIMWKIMPHRLFFGRSHTCTWGEGGVAFLHPESSIDDKTYMCLYRITLEQFNDLIVQENVLVQENVQHDSMITPFFDSTSLDSAVTNKSIVLEAIKEGWYSNVVHLGTEGALHILTMTCSLSDVESFKSGEHPLRAPSKGYMNTLVRGLVQGKQLSEDEAISYINGACTKPL
ncbi:hypothetical protein Syun_023269 [Stephania yunnanensis]|uniref:histone deacetylase n=1 Tax=Stephania yunnanensis TaxID=152371 RepID=A0AAP0FMA3_9MAGN